MSRKGRDDKILIDYLRNNRTNTSVAAFSTRARPHAPLSVTLTWEELSPRIPSDHYTALTEQSLVEAAELAGLTTTNLITRFLPYTTKSRIPQHRLLVRAYLAFPPLWRLLGQQTLYIGTRRD